MTAIQIDVEVPFDFNSFKLTLLFNPCDVFNFFIECLGGCVSCLDNVVDHLVVIVLTVSAGNAPLVSMARIEQVYCRLLEFCLDSNTII